MKPTTKKIVVVGDGACGKTCMLEVFRNHAFPSEYVPTVVDNFARPMEVGENKKIILTVWDTAGQEDYNAIRKLSYKNTDLVLICYSIESKVYFSNVSDKWLIEVKNLCPNALIYLVGLKSDLREEIEKDENYTHGEIKNLMQDFVVAEKGQEMADKIEATKFFECSARKNIGVTDIFESAAIDLYELEQQNNSTEGVKGLCCCFK